MAVDFRMPRGIKKDVRLTDGTTFIGINAVHSDDRMRLDIQSIANLHPFFSTETMATYLKQHETLSDQAVISGAKGEGVARLNGATRRELDDQPKREYLASGGPATALPSLIDQCYSGAIENIEQNLEKGKLRIPVPGGRY